jgi:hypothetical protein
MILSWAIIATIAAAIGFYEAVRAKRQAIALDDECLNLARRLRVVAQEKADLIEAGQQRSEAAWASTSNAIWPPGQPA